MTIRDKLSLKARCQENLKPSCRGTGNLPNLNYAEVGLLTTTLTG